MVADIVFLIVIVALALPGLAVLVLGLAIERRSAASAANTDEGPIPGLFKPTRSYGR